MLKVVVHKSDLQEMDAVVFVVLGVEPRALPMPNKHSPTEPH